MAKIIPDFAAFEAAYEAGKAQLVHARLAADLDTPVSLMLKLAGARTDSFMLESVTGGEVRGRYSVVGLKPDLIWECRGETSRVNRHARFDADAWEAMSGSPLDTLRAVLAESAIEIPDDLPPIAA
ncbi:MAG TPA: anthranilate synthase component I, partial [Rhodovulum sp.]|nr:anthranilate synthase component I [Rhodovulum sp.]